MRELVAWARNVLIALAALALFAGVATQLLAAVFSYAAHFGEHAPPWFGFPLYEPWRFLKWGFSLAPFRPWIAFLCIVLALTFVLAAFAVLALAGLVAPNDLPHFRSRRGFASWDILGQRGLLGANGLALGAVRRHWWTKQDIVSAPSGNVLIVGEPKHTDAALIAAASTWRGPLLFIDTRGLASKLPRSNVIRFAPGQKDSFSYNPMLAIRGGVHAWADACLLAQSFLQSSDNALTEAFAILALDQLINAPLEQRNLAALRKRLAAPYRLLTEIVAAWPEGQCAVSAPHSEIARAVRTWCAHPNATLAHIADIDAALAGFSEGGNLAPVTQAHQFCFADLVAGSGPHTLVLSVPPGEAASMARLLSSILAQLVAACASAPASETPGSSEQQQILIVVEAGALPLWRQILPAEAAAHGCHLLVQAPSLEHATSDAFGTIAAIGPQSGPTADKLSVRAGHVSEWLLLRRDEVSIRNWVFPRWVKLQRQVMPAADLTEADPSQAMLFVQGLAPVRARSLYLEGSQATFVAAELQSAAHDWATPPPPIELPEPTASPVQATSPLIGAQIRAVLTRRAPPRSKAKARQ